MGSRVIDYLTILPLYLLPRRWLTRLFYSIAQNEKVWLKDFIIDQFCLAFDVDLSESRQENVSEFKHFNAFFTRQLKPTARPLCGDGEIASPADGRISQIGPILQDKLVQIKGLHYSITDLIGKAEISEQFIHGQYATIYLAPRDYHRVHMPLGGKLKGAYFIPGDLFPVKPASVRCVRDLFARNERLVCLFETELGPMLVILVGALLVGSIETVWHGLITPPHGQRQYDYQGKDEEIEKGQELGRFNMGSTVIVLFPAGKVQWSLELQEDSPVKMGQSLGKIL